MQKENVWFKDFQVALNETGDEICMVAEHWHNCWELLFLESGSVTQICDSGITLFSAGDIILIAPKTVHSTLAGKGGSRIVVVQFDESLWPGARESGYPAQQNPFLPEMTHLFRLLLREFSGRQDGFLNLTHGALLQIFGYLTRLSGITMARSAGYFKTKPIFSYIDAHLGENITLEQAARDLGYSPQHMTQLMKVYSGYSFKPYVDYARIMAAVRLLKFENIAVSEVAERLGYSDVTAFSRAFKRVIGQSPRAFKS